MSVEVQLAQHGVLCCCGAGCGSEAEQAQLFTRLWALKEAVVKARGTGISAAPGLKGFAVGKLAGYSSLVH
jgi:phosphopantetheinyl transferase